MRRYHPYLTRFKITAIKPEMFSFHSEVGIFRFLTDSHQPSALSKENLLKIMSSSKICKFILSQKKKGVKLFLRQNLVTFILYRINLFDIILQEISVVECLPNLL